MNRIVLCNNCEHSFLPKDVTPQFPILDSLNNLFRSNQLPSSAETQEVRAYIEAEDCELARCEQEISHLHNALRALEAHRATLLERIKRCQSWFSPIRRLPVEILGKIFAFICTPESGTYALDVDNWRFSAPILALTHVSHHWREVASASPSLWSPIRVHLSYDDLDGDQMVQVQSLLNLYLTKSRDHPLHLINFRCIGYREQGQDPITQLLALHIPRIARLDLVEPQVPGSINRHILQVPEWLAESLRNDVVLKLSDMTISPHSLNSDILPCHQLRVLEIVDIIDTQPLGPVLRLCTNLHSLTLHLLNDGHPEVLDAGALIKIPSLRQLTITVGLPSGLSLLLPHLVLPSLSSLRISAYGASFLSPVTDLIRRSGCHLEEFTMEVTYGRYDMTNADLVNFLTSCPELWRLEVDVTDPSYKDIYPGTSVCQLLDALSSVSLRQTPITFPKLSYVIVSERWTTLNPETVDAVLGKLEARVGALKDYRARVSVPRWKWDLRFGGLPDCTPDVLEGFESRIENLAKNGLKWTALPFTNEAE